MPGKTKQRKGRAAATAPSKEKKKRVGANTGAVGYGQIKQNTTAAKPNRSPVRLMENKITGIEASTAQYILGLTTPGLPCRVPVVLGEFELDTNTYSYVFNGTFSTTSSGFGYLCACQDGWWQTNGNVQENLSYLANTTGGYPLWYTPAGSVASNTPAVGQGADVNHAKVQLPKLDPGHNAGSRGRLTAVILSVWPDSPATTTQGDLCVAAISSEQALDDAALNVAIFSTVAAYPQEYVAHLEMPLANWDSNKQAHAIPVPFSEDCFAIEYLPTTGSVNCNQIIACALVSGAASGQTLRYRVEYKYETTAPNSYLTGMENSYGAIVPVPKETLAPHLSQLRPMAVTALPAKHLPGLAMSAAKNADPGLVTKIAKAAATGGLGKTLGKVVSSGIKSIPYVGGVLGSVFDSIFA